MTSELHTAADEYRVVVIDPKSRRLWAIEKEGEYRLVRIAVAQGTRVARELQEAISKTWGFTVLILDLMATADSVPSCAVAELLHGMIPAGLRVVQMKDISSRELSEQEQSLLQLMLDGNANSQIARIGWIDEAITWIEDSTGRRVSSKSEVIQYNASGEFTLVRFQMDKGCNYWLKATGESSTHERPVTSLLSKLCGGYVPDVVAEMPAWNAWLMRGDGVGVAALPPEPSEAMELLEAAAASLGDLQAETVGGDLALLDAGAFDHRTHALRAEAAPLFAYLEEAMDLQTSTKVPRVATKRLHELQDIFENTCSQMEELRLPDTVLHGDMNIGNIVVGESGCMFIDWCEAYVGNPLITFEHLALLNSIENPPLKTDCDQRLRGKYRRSMSKLCEPKAIDQGFAFAPLIAAVSAIFGRGSWLRTPLRDDPRRQAYVRAIARHMDRAAREPSLLAALAV